MLTDMIYYSNPNFDLMRQHVLRDPRLLQQLANVSIIWLDISLGTKSRRMGEHGPE